ncbi:MAG: hypothetical protein OEV00_03135 [Acidobacteriota bacterium]|nr:hypothetical protein [Acidobacteriota bacterium]MDH3784303.1 hypothetical protein [Acidobacteriota bacterium]
MRQKQTQWMALTVAALSLAVVVGVTAPEAQAAGRRVVADMDQPFVINGQLFDTGRLSIQTISSYTPGTEMNELWVDNTCVGYLLSKSQDGELGARDRFLFDRQADGHVVLVGFQFRGESRQAIYKFRFAAAGGEWLPPGPQKSDTPIVMASR